MRKFPRAHYYIMVIIFTTVAGLYIYQNLSSQRTNDAAPTSSEVAQAECIELGNGVCIDIEVVRSREAMQRGLSDRLELPENAGMLFDFQTEGVRCMWMKDMNFALDMIWLDADAAVVDVQTNITPETFPDSFCGAEPARYVLEVNTGVASRSAVEVGQRVQLDSLMLR